MIPPFSESTRYDYPLTPDSVVIDAGGFEGNWAAVIAARYDCTVHVLEPVSRFRERIDRNRRLLMHAKATVHPWGVAAQERHAVFHVAGDSSGEWAFGLPDEETVRLRGIGEVLAELAPNGCALLKLNIEGAEFEVLEWLVGNTRCRVVAGGQIGAWQTVKGAEHLLPDNIQVQFHSTMANAEARYDAIAAGLSRTHELTWQSKWCWENWRRK
jgi:FkbM family methyltransferase